MGIMPDKKLTVEQCEVLKEAYDRYKTGTMNKIEKLKLGFINSEFLLHSIFGMVKFGSEYYAKCDTENYEKSSILGRIADRALKMVENDIIYKNTKMIRNVLNQIKKEVKPIEQLEKAHKSHITNIKKNYNKL